MDETTNINASLVTIEYIDLELNKEMQDRDQYLKVID